MKDDFNSRFNSQGKLGYAAITNNPKLSGALSGKVLLFAPAMCPLRADCSLCSISSYPFHSVTQVGRAVTVWNVAGSIAERKRELWRVINICTFLATASCWPTQPV